VIDLIINDGTDRVCGFGLFRHLTKFDNHVNIPSECD
jgi:hypothetical protein